MPKKYKIVRMPVETYRRYFNIKCSMENDLKKLTGKPQKLTMTKVFKAVVNPQLNENYIQVDLKNLLKLSKRRGA